jgi:hypothetical protein
MNLIHAKDLPREQSVLKITLEEKVNSFIEGKLMPCIVTSARLRQNSTVKEWEYWMYEQNREVMLKTFNDKLNPFGYSISFSHDGSGIYDTIVVKW